jgi:hypothetical protein
MSGRLPFRTGVRGDVGFEIDRSETLLAEVLRDRAPTVLKSARYWAKV